MGQDYDKIFKENIEQIILPLAKKVLNLPEPEGLVEIPDDLQRTVERRPDFLKIVTDRDGNGLFVLQLEFQTADELDMRYRMLVYAALLLEKYHLPVKQYVFYIGNRQARMNPQIEQENLSFRFIVRNVVDIPYTTFLETDKPEEVVLAILANPNGESPKVVIRKTLQALRQTAKDKSSLERFLRQIEVLSKLRELQEETVRQIEAMPIVYDLETDIRYLQGKQKGAEEASLPALLKGLEEGRREGRQETKREDVKGLLQLGVLTPEQISQALSVPLDFVLSVQASLRSAD